MKLVPANEWLKREESAEITIAGSREDVGQALEQLAWLAATFRKHEGSSMIASYSSLTLARRPSPERSLPLFDLSIFAPRPVPFKAGTPASCWVRLLPASVLACGFPYAPRAGGVGLEVPFYVMVHLTGAQFPVKYGEGIVFRGRQAHGSVMPMLVPTLSMKDSIQWHFLESSSEPSLATSEDRQFLEAMGDSTPLDPLKNSVDIDSRSSTDNSPRDDVGDSKFWFQTTDLDILTNSRAFLGAWKAAKVHIGTRAFERHIQPSSRQDANGRRVDRPLNLRSYSNKISAPPALRIKQENAMSRHGQLLDDLQWFRLSARHPMLLYDSGAHRAWLVSELSVALQLAHNHLNDMMQISPRIRRRLRYADAKDDGGTAAEDAIGRCRKEKMWDETTFATIVRTFLLMIEAAKGYREPRSSDSIYVSEFVDLQKFLSSPQSTRQDEADNHALSPSWWSIARDPRIAIVFGSHFGQVITPDTSRIRVCSFWKAIPEGKGLLTASMPCFSAFLNIKDDCCHHPDTSALFKDCMGDAKCNLIQESAIITQGRSRLPTKGAIVFGDNHLDELPIRCTRMDFTTEYRHRAIIWPFFFVTLAWLLALAAAG